MAPRDGSESPPMVFPSSPEAPAPGGNRPRNSLPSSFNINRAGANPNVSSVLAPHPSTMRQPTGTFAEYISITKSWEVGVFTDRQIAESRLGGVAGGSSAHTSSTWGSAFRYYSICYYAGTVNIARKLFDAPVSLISSPATGTPSHPFVVTSSPVTPVTPVTPATGTPTHPYSVSSSSLYSVSSGSLYSPFSSQTSNVSTPIPALFAYSQASPTPSATGTPTHAHVLHSNRTPGSSHHQATTGLQSIPASFAPALSQGSPTPASRSRQFLLPAPLATDMQPTGIVSVPPAGLPAMPAPPVFLPTILTNTNPTAPTCAAAALPAAPTVPPAFLPSILTNTNPITNANPVNALAQLVVYVSSDSESDAVSVPCAPRIAGHRSASAHLASIRLAQDGSTGPVGPPATATATPTVMTPRRNVFVADSDDEDYAIKTPVVARLPGYPSASVRFGRSGSSTHSPAMPTNTVTFGPGGSTPHRTSSLIVEPDSDELRCSDLEDGDYADMDMIFSQ
ncbi:hypothetical protein GALMADRAFT_143472 [Galerina marginata CBS 339.88]|uniref:Uncharacterized protein n=1 Tax=Galerina marginata (strain CBS 339.88) TaxID=685588 RepID=A0A067SZF8_GALM3|nr:hypothetical protein GALMADRAFT_143472 [Galerina marginata CBS 339.88]